MKERPILFKPEMVRAILAGDKTQTRRIITKPQDINGPHHEWSEAIRLSDGTWSFWYPGNEDLEEFANKVYPNGGGIACPYGKPGDRLWVREAHWLVPTTAYRASDVEQKVNPNDPHEAVIWAADWPLTEPDARKRPSIHMPRWACRLTLRITDVRVERVQDITEADAKAEGVNAWHDTKDGTVYSPEFILLWDKINAGRGYPWADNPWVWVVEFVRADE